MSRILEFPNPIRIDRLTRVFRLNGVDVFVHWTVFLIAGLMVYATRRSPWVTLTAGASWLCLLLLHECGHMIAARRRHTRIISIELYPIFGFCRFEIPWSRFDHCIIAWGGIIAQLVVAVPIILCVSAFGYTRFAPLNAILGILGGYSLVLGAFNLLPVRPLDGSMAWRIVPEFIKRVKSRNKKKASAAGWR
ncbi:MAG TPA: site-2 protease family protein [Candidatus Angelobacter sp.]|jgi:Zn-dependent protease|nr:site-2 protease family protein [Candidatus Angelobacter sp.]